MLTKALTICLGLGKTLVLDPEFAELYYTNSWFIDSTTGYLSSSNGSGCGVTHMHRCVLNAANGQLVDHINNDKLDNRKLNLRFSNKSLNGVNTKTIQKHKKILAPRGIYSRPNNKWTARINILGVNYDLGLFKTVTEAYEARVKFANEKLGEFSPYYKH